MHAQVTTHFQTNATSICVLPEQPRTATVSAFHPTRPWVITVAGVADSARGCLSTIFDYRRRVSSSCFTVGQPLDAAAAAAHNPHPNSTPAPAAMSPSRTAAGKGDPLKNVGQLIAAFFVDAETRAWKLLEEEKRPGNSGDDIVRVGEAFTKTCLRACGAYVVLVFEGRVYAHNYVTGKTEILQIADGRGISYCSAEFFGHERFVAFGCTDGTVRLYDIEEKRMVHVLTRIHKPNATINTLCSCVLEGKSYLFCGGSDGVVSMWDVTAGVCTSVIKAHDSGGVTGLVYLAHRQTLVSCGGDRYLCSWSVVPGKDKIEIKERSKRLLGNKNAFLRIGRAPFSGMGTDTIAVLLRDSLEILVCRSDLTDIRILLDASITASGDTKGHKLHWFATHPRNRNTIMLNGTKGACILALGINRRIPIVSVPKNTKEKDGEKVAVLHIENSLYQQNLVDNTDTFGKKVCTCSMDTSFTEMERDSDGNGIVVYSKAIGSFEVFFREKPEDPKSYKSVSVGMFNQNIAVSTSQHAMACCEVVPLSITSNGAGPDTSGASTPIGISPDMVESGLGDGQGGLLYNTEMRFSIKDYSLSGCRDIWKDKALSNKIERLFGGYLLGVAFKETDKKKGSVLAFYQWKGVEDKYKASEMTFPIPKQVIWHPDGSYVALLYPAEFTVYSHEKDESGHSVFSEIYTRHVEAMSLLWGENRVFVATPSDIRCYYLDLLDEPILLAHGTTQTDEDDEVCACPLNLRPPGDISLLGETEKGIFLADADRCTYRLSSSSTYMSCITAVAAGDADTALLLAKDLPPSAVRPVELALARRGFLRHALRLPGLSDWHILQRYVANGFLSDAVPLLEKVAASFSEGKKTETQDDDLTLIPLDDLPVASLSGAPGEETLTKESLLALAADLAGACRAYEQPSEEVVAMGPEVTEVGETAAVRALAGRALAAVRQIDYGKVALLEAIQGVTAGDKAMLEELKGRVKKESEKEDVDEETRSVLRAVLVLVETCLGGQKDAEELLKILAQM